MIKLSVCVPMFRAKHCGWIALESLIRQEGIDFDWELVVAEELDFSPFKKARILDYKQKLKEVGCVRIKYFGLKHWERLSNKLVFMAKKSARTSLVYASNAADLYSPPQRLKTQYDVFTGNLPEMKKKTKYKFEKVDFYSSARTIVYDIETEKYYLNDGLKKLERDRSSILSDGSCRSLRMDIMKKMPPLAHVPKGVDSWVWHQARSIVENKGKEFVHFLESSNYNWMFGLNVNGLNNITKNVRQIRAEGRRRPFFIVDCPIDIRNTIPSEILDRLKDVKKHVKKNDMTRPTWVPHKRPGI